jgi:hypothetical protein
MRDRVRESVRTVAKKKLTEGRSYKVGSVIQLIPGPDSVFKAGEYVVTKIENDNTIHIQKSDGSSAHIPLQLDRFVDMYGGRIEIVRESVEEMYDKWDGVFPLKHGDYVMWNGSEAQVQLPVGAPPVTSGRVTLRLWDGLRLIGDVSASYSELRPMQESVTEPVYKNGTYSTSIEISCYTDRDYEYTLEYLATVVGRQPSDIEWTGSYKCRFSYHGSQGEINQIAGKLANVRIQEEVKENYDTIT